MIVVAALLLLAQVPTEPVTLASLRYIDTVTGTGAPAASGKRFRVHYTGTLTDGTKFDSSVDRKEPFQFVQGRRQVIAGWDLGFEGMKVGGKRRLFVPYQLAYGEKGSGPIPPRAELIFDVELLAVEDAPALQPSIDLLLPFVDLETRVNALANGVPAERFAAIAPMLLRIANLAASPDVKAGEMKAEGRAAVAELLARNLAAMHSRIDTLRNGALAGDAEVFGKPSNLRGTYSAMNAAIAEQLGQAEVLARPAIR